MKNRKLTTAILISLLLHIMLIALIYYSVPVTKPAKDEQIVMIDLKNNGMKIADIEKPAVEKRPDKSEHLGLYDSSVDEETVAAETPRAPGRPTTRGGEGMDKVKEAVKEAAKEVVKDKAHGAGMPDYKVPKEQKADKGLKGPKETLPPSLAGKMPEDFYPDYKKGGHTYINVMKHPDVGYFVMMKKVLKMAWDPTSVLMKRSYAGEVSRGSIKVVLGIAIDKTGEVGELFVINGSGMGDYDAEALRAVRVSAPFAAPPAKLLASDGILRISWSFTVYI